MSEILWTEKGGSSNVGGGALTIPQKKTPSMAKCTWHAPWKLYRVISGHLGWVRYCAVESGNEWFATGSADRVIKVGFPVFNLAFSLLFIQ
ncbi:pleiotropic regulator 1-like [Ooceraea biroi]|uniref:pleiotropic regulator 1-like n=1 Tax=Ooceraea biroi TaxID=2015173 RepID=UPI0005BAD26C|nr:pleiotropic regulator 1-like [Ooceraea biroi]